MGSVFFWFLWFSLVLCREMDCVCIPAWYLVVKGRKILVLLHQFRLRQQFRSECSLKILLNVYSYENILPLGSIIFFPVNNILTFVLTSYFVVSFTFHTKSSDLLILVCFEISIHLLTHVSASFFASTSRQVQTQEAKVQWKVPELREEYLSNHPRHRMPSWNLLCV